MNESDIYITKKLISIFINRYNINHSGKMHRSSVSSTSMMFKTESELKNKYMYKRRVLLTVKQQYLIDDVRFLPGYFKDGKSAIKYGTSGFPSILDVEFKKVVKMMFIQADPETKKEATKLSLMTCLNDNCINHILELLF